MYLLGSTADDYLSNALEFITTSFSIPESLAGVTLLAFGNGAPDVFASMSSASTSKKIGDVSITSSLATLLGGGFFLTTVVTGLSLRASENQEIRVTKNFFLREMTFLIAVYVYLIATFFLYGKIDIYISAGFFIIYFVYVAMVIIQSKIKSKPNARDSFFERSVSLNAQALDFVKHASQYMKNKEGSVSLNQLENAYQTQTSRKFSQRKPAPSQNKKEIETNINEDTHDNEGT